MNSSLPCLCFIGPLVGRHPGYVTTQGLILADHFSEASYPVISASDKRNRYARLVDVVGTHLVRGHAVDIQSLEVYGGSSFVVEDVSSLLGKLCGQKIVMVLHGGALPQFIAKFPRWARRVFRRADAIVTPSPYLARTMKEYGFRAMVIPNVVDLSEYRFRHRTSVRPRLFWMRTFHDVWNPAMAVRVLARLQQDYPDATLVMAGQDKGQQVEMQKLASQLGISEAVRFPGFLDREAKAREGEAADIFISTSHIDNMPVAILEAGAMGLPVVSTDVGGVPDLITDGVNGVLVPDDDDAAMAHAIRRLIEEPEFAARLSENGRQLAERSSWDRVRAEWERVFAGLLRE